MPMTLPEKLQKLSIFKNSIKYEFEKTKTYLIVRYIIIIAFSKKVSFFFFKYDNYLRFRNS